MIRMLARLVAATALLVSALPAVAASDPAARGLAVQAQRAIPPTANAALLRALAAKADISNPIDKPPLSPPPLWAASTAYTIGQAIRTSTGRVYLCLVAGTSGSSEPTQEWPAQVADGSVYWAFYSGGTGTADALNPVVTTGVYGNYTDSIAPYTNVYHFDVDSANVTLLNAASLKTGNGQAQPQGWPDGNGGYTASGGRIAFESEATSLLLIYSWVNTGIRVMVDGRWHTIGPETMTLTNGGKAFSYTKLDWTNAGGRKTRRYVIEGTQGAYVGLTTSTMMGVATTSYEQIRPIPAPSATMVAISDSWGVSAGAGLLIGGQFPTVVGDLLGIDNVLNLSIGGTGYVARGSGSVYSTFAQRPALVANPLKVNLWLLAGSINDNASTASAIAAGVQATIAAIRATGSKAPIVIVGVQSVYSSGAPVTGPGALNEAAQQAGIAASGDKGTFYVPVIGDPNGPWLSGDYNNSGRGTYYPVIGQTYGDIFNDGAHTFDKVYTWLWAKWIATAIKTKVYPQLAPTN